MSDQDNDPQLIQQIVEGDRQAFSYAAGWGLAEDPEVLALALEDRARLHQALAALSPEDREIIVFRDMEQLTAPEVAAALGITEAAVKSRLHRARLRLMARLRGGGGE